MAGKQVAGYGMPPSLAGMSNNHLCDIMCQMKALIEQISSTSEADSDSKSCSDESSVSGTNYARNGAAPSSSSNHFSISVTNFSATNNANSAVQYSGRVIVSS